MLKLSSCEVATKRRRCSTSFIVFMAVLMLIHFNFRHAIIRKLLHDIDGSSTKRVMTFQSSNEDVIDVQDQVVAIESLPSSSSPSASSSLLLSVPFYIYEELDWFAMDNLTVENRSLAEYIDAGVSHERNPKHDDDLLLYQAATKHPMRTYDPTQAKLFLVPSLTSIIVFAHVYHPNAKKICWKDICDRDLMVYTEQVLANSTWFHRHNGNDHLAFQTVFHFRHPAFKGKSFKHFLKCHLIQFGEDSKLNKDDRLMFPGMHIGNRCSRPSSSMPKSLSTATTALSTSTTSPSLPITSTFTTTPNTRMIMEDKKYDLAMIASIRKAKSYQDRKNICKWTDEGNYSMSVCGRGVQCPALSQSRLGFHVQGDSLSSNRLFDTLLSGTVPIFTLREQYNLHPSWIDWEQLSYFANVENSTIFHVTMNEILVDEERIQQKTKAVVENMELFDFQTLVPFDLYMYFVQSHLFPETRTNTSRFSALILPKQFE